MLDRQAHQWRIRREVKIATIVLLLFLLSSGCSKAEQPSPPDTPTPLTNEQVQPIVQRYVSDWSSRNPKYPLWVQLAAPGDRLYIPGATFLPEKEAGMSMSIHAYLIVLSNRMVPESILQTFTHEYGHAQYWLAHPNDFNAVDSEVAAVKSSLTMLPKEGFDYLAYREAKAIKVMSKVEPYQSAVSRLSTDPLWIKYSQ
jgi:hypothetical protein